MGTKTMKPTKSNLDEATLTRLENAARDGDRVTFQAADSDKETTLWPGLGNRSGLHGFASELIRERWAKSGERYLTKLRGLPAGKVAVKEFQNKTRDRGRWVKTFEVELTAD